MSTQIDGLPSTGLAWSGSGLKGNMTLPISLTLAAVWITLFGVPRPPMKAKKQSTRGLLLLWLCLFLGGLAIWMLVRR